MGEWEVLRGVRGRVHHQSDGRIIEVGEKTKSDGDISLDFGGGGRVGVRQVCGKVS